MNEVVDLAQEADRLDDVVGLGVHRDQPVAVDAVHAAHIVEVGAVIRDGNLMGSCARLGD